MLLLDSLKTICATRYPFQMSKISDLCTKQILIIRRCIWFTELKRMAAQASHAKHRSLPLQVSCRLSILAFLFFKAVFTLSDQVTLMCAKLGNVSNQVFLSDLSRRDQLGSDTESHNNVLGCG